MNEQESQAAALGAYLQREFTAAQSLPGITGIWRTVPGAYLGRLPQSLFCLQTYRPLADELNRTGRKPIVEIKGTLSQAIVFATKHREEVLCHLAQAAEALEEGGNLIVVAANTLGAPSLERRTADLMGSGITCFSKHKCRVFQGKKDSTRLNAGLLREWHQGGEMRQQEASGLYSCPGLFSWKTIDIGSRLLAEQLPADLKGRGADLGAGYGYLSREALIRAPGIQELHLVEAEAKALAAAQLNLAGLAGQHALHFEWADVTAGLTLAGLDFVLMNPPFHAGRGALPALGRAFVREAVKALRPGGRLFMVANRHLPYEAELTLTGATVESSRQQEGFKVILARKEGS